jgi:hypothetical protein
MRLLWLVAALVVVAVFGSHPSTTPSEAAGSTCLVIICVTSTSPPAPKAPCLGDGVSGKRVALFYGQYAGEVDESQTAIPAIRNAANAVNQGFVGAGNQDVRWLCNATGQTVTKMFLVDKSLSGVIATMRALGYTRTDRIYEVVTKSADPRAPGYTGFGTVDNDDRPTNNANDSGPAYSVVYGYSNSHAMWHEFGHNLGAVQLSAPHSSGAWHCYDASDVMCYDDGGPYFQQGGKLWYRCSSEMFDCGHDDFYSRFPSGYLATHWNLYKSGFLQPR